ncbi:MAG: SGNH/GDSL hydrolase family protein [Marinobacter sp.]
MIRKTRTVALFKRAIFAASITFTSSLVLAVPLTFNNIFVLGDSLSDTGNTKSRVPFGGFAPVANFVGYGSNGRFSNGPVWHEYLADSLGISRATNSEGGGNNYAFGGARVNNDGGVSAGILDQEDQYNNNQPDSANAGDLFITWAGGNDMRDLVNVINPIAAIEAQLDSFIGVMTRLVANGVRTLLVPNLPNLGMIPEFAGSTESSAATAVSQDWNEGLEKRLTALSATTSASIFYLDVFGIFGSILDDTTGTSGFTNTTDQCRSVTLDILTNLTAEVECTNADSYLFWDNIHPTTAAHNRLGHAAFALLASGNKVTVPEPAVIWLMLLGIGAVAGRRAMVTKAA